MSLEIGPASVPLATTPDGAICVAETRVTLDTVVAAFCEGATAEEIAQQYPSLPLHAVYAVITYYLQRTTEVEAYLRTRAQDAQRVRRENETLSDPSGIRTRLLARPAHPG